MKAPIPARRVRESTVAGIVHRARRIVGVALALAACGGEDERPSATAGPPPAPSDSVPSDPRQAPDSGIPSPAAPGYTVAIDGEGLRLVEAETGSTRPLPFGSEQSLVLDALVVAWGPWRERSPLPDCSADPTTFVSWRNGLAVLLQDGRFIGWSAGPPRPGEMEAPAAVTTMAGVGVGSKRGEVEAAYSVRVSTTTLGEEFSLGDLYGIFSDATPDAEVVALWAGTVCLFR